MKIAKRVIVGAVAAALALSFAACTGSDPTPPPPVDSTDAPPAGGGAISIRGCTPQEGLIGGNTQEVCGGHVLDAITARLIHYDPKTAEPILDIAKSIDTNEDATVFVVHLKEGVKFSDGTEVKAHNFVDAWNHAVYSPNGMSQVEFFEPIAGFDDLKCEEDGCTPAADKMSGLTIQNDYQFTITTSTPTSNLVVRLGYTAFNPEPDAFFTGDKEAFGKAPVGAGPYMVTSYTTDNIKLERNPNYVGDWAGHVDEINYRIYNDMNAAYADVLANNLDYIDQVPSDQMINNQWVSDLGADRTSTTPAGTIQTATFMPNDKQLAGNVALRRAIGQAIDRDTITEQIFAGARKPMTGWISPSVDGYKEGQCGDACIYNPEKAKADYAASGGYKGVFMLSVNGDGGHAPWAQAVCNSLKNTLGMECEVNITPDFKTLLDQAKAGELEGMIRSGWAMDYPSIENYLTPMFAKGAASNYSKYDNPAFEKLLKDAAAAPSLAEANALYQQAEALFVESLPSVPLWFYTTNSAWSNKVDNVLTTPFGYLDYTSITVK